MNALQIFASADFRIRAVMRDGEPWFVAVDICRALSIVDDRQAVDRLDPDERGGCIVPTPRGDQMVRAVSEAGLYSMIQTSRKPEAKLFRRWINHEVLPSIRKTGVYAIQPTHEIPKTYGEALRRAASSTWRDASRAGSASKLARRHDSGRDSPAFPSAKKKACADQGIRVLLVCGQDARRSPTNHGAENVQDHYRRCRR